MHAVQCKLFTCIKTDGRVTHVCFCKKVVCKNRIWQFPLVGIQQCAGVTFYKIWNQITNVCVVVGGVVITYELEADVLSQDRQSLEKNVFFVVLLVDRREVVALIFRADWSRGWGPVSGQLTKDTEEIGEHVCSINVGAEGCVCMLCVFPFFSSVSLLQFFCLVFFLSRLSVFHFCKHSLILWFYHF